MIIAWKRISLRDKNSVRRAEILNLQIMHYNGKKQKNQQYGDDNINEREDKEFYRLPLFLENQNQRKHEAKNRKEGHNKNRRTQH